MAGFYHVRLTVKFSKPRVHMALHEEQNEHSHGRVLSRSFESEVFKTTCTHGIARGTKRAFTWQGFITFVWKWSFQNHVYTWYSTRNETSIHMAGFYHVRLTVKFSKPRVHMALHEEQNEHSHGRVLSRSFESEVFKTTCTHGIARGTKRAFTWQGFITFVWKWSFQNHVYTWHSTRNKTSIHMAGFYHVRLKVKFSKPRVHMA